MLGSLRGVWADGAAGALSQVGTGAGPGVLGVQRQRWQNPGVCSEMLRACWQAARGNREIGPVPLRGFFAAWQGCPPGQPIHPSILPPILPPILLPARQHRPRGWRRRAPLSSRARGAAGHCWTAAGHCGVSGGHCGAEAGAPPARPARPAPRRDGEETRAGNPRGQRPARLPPLSTATEPNRAEPSRPPPRRTPRASPLCLRRRRGGGAAGAEPPPRTLPGEPAGEPRASGGAGDGGGRRGAGMKEEHPRQSLPVPTPRLGAGLSRGEPLAGFSAP